LFFATKYFQELWFFSFVEINDQKYKLLVVLWVYVLTTFGYRLLSLKVTYMELYFGVKCLTLKYP